MGVAIYVDGLVDVGKPQPLTMMPRMPGVRFPTLGPTLCTSHYQTKPPPPAHKRHQTNASNLSRIIEEHDGTLSHFNGGRSTQRSNMSEACNNPLRSINMAGSEVVTMEMVNKYEINRRVQESRALPKNFTTTRHRRAHIARQGRRNPLVKPQRLPVLHSAASRHYKPWQVGNGASKAFAQAVYEPPHQQHDVLQQTFNYVGRHGGRRPPIRFDDLDANGDGKVSKNEWVAHLGNSDGFSDYDLNGDGTVSQEEFRKGRLNMKIQRRNTTFQR